MVEFVRAEPLARALGVTRQTLGAWVRAGKIPLPTTSAGEWRRWPVAVAIEILTSRGCPVPAAWTAPAIERAA